MKNSHNSGKACLAFCFTGVAEQFALAEAAMNVWPINDCTDQPSTSLQGLSAADNSGLCAGFPLSLIKYRPTTQLHTSAQSSPKFFNNSH